MSRRSRVAEANAHVEEEFDEFSDEEDEEIEQEETDDLDLSTRLNQPVSYNRSLFELYRTLASLHLTNFRTGPRRTIHEYQSRLPTRRSLVRKSNDPPRRLPHE